MILGVNYIEFYVKDLESKCRYFQDTFNFKLIWRGEIMEGSSALLRQADIKILLTSSKDTKSDVSSFFSSHGDGVKDIALNVSNLDKTLSSAIEYGAKVLLPPTFVEMAGEKYLLAKISAFGDVVHSLIEHQEAFDEKLEDSLLINLDHVAICVSKEELAKQVEFYQRAFGFKHTHTEDIDTGQSGMYSKVVESKNSKVKLVFTAPLEKYCESQISSFIEANHGDGVQHLAFNTNDIVSVVNSLRKSGVGFLNVPEKYYQQRINDLPGKKDIIKKFMPLNILVDCVEEGYLYQLFTESLGKPKTFFLEIIQRENYSGFGRKNIEALFKSLEREFSHAN